MLARQVQYFLAVAEHLSFTRAASALHVSQPALSQQVRQLEESLGTQLFDRSGRSTRLTDAGEVYLRHARAALQALQQGQRALHDVADLSEGLLRLAVTPTFTAYLVGPLVEAFHRLYPGIRLHLRELPQEQMEALLLADELDVGIAFEQANAQDIEARPLLMETLALVVGDGHPLAGQTTIDARVLGKESLILLGSEFATREQIDRYCRQHAIQPRILMEANAISAVLEVVRRTSLSTLLPAAIAANADGLNALALEPWRLERTAALLQRRGGYQSAAARAFIEVANELARPTPEKTHSVVSTCKP
ncbi:MAG: transcriptional regulator CynR [Paucimonas sp.]|jgi:LysR family cyn operon transcriptional activator|nr:transcriptional regulator CynR [Paucimonas sp.]